MNEENSLPTLINEDEMDALERQDFEERFFGGTLKAKKIEMSEEKKREILKRMGLL